MRVLAAAVLTMESILMGFALLIAKDDASVNENNLRICAGNTFTSQCWSFKA